MRALLLLALLATLAGCEASVGDYTMRIGYKHLSNREAGDKCWSPNGTTRAFNNCMARYGQ